MMKHDHDGEESLLSRRRSSRSSIQKFLSNAYNTSSILRWTVQLTTRFQERCGLVGGASFFFEPKTAVQKIASLANIVMKPSRKQQVRLAKGRKLKIGKLCMACFVPCLVIFQVVIVSVLDGDTKNVLRSQGDNVTRQLLDASTTKNARGRSRMKLEVQMQHQQSFSPSGVWPRASCNATFDRVRAYNPWSRNQYLCGQAIPPNRSVEIVKCCQEGPRVFPQEPSITNIQLDEPVDLTFHINTRRQGQSPIISYSECTVPCRRMEPVGIITILRLSGLNWEIRHTLESSHQHGHVEVMKDSWKRDIYYSTTSFKSEVST